MVVRTASARSQVIADSNNKLWVDISNAYCGPMYSSLGPVWLRVGVCPEIVFIALAAPSRRSKNCIKLTAWLSKFSVIFMRLEIANTMIIVLTTSKIHRGVAHPTVFINTKKKRDFGSQSWKKRAWRTPTPYRGLSKRSLTFSLIKRRGKVEAFLTGVPLCWKSWGHDTEIGQGRLKRTSEKSFHWADQMDLTLREAHQPLHYRFSFSTSFMCRSLQLNFPRRHVENDLRLLETELIRAADNVCWEDKKLLWATM